MKVFHDEFYLNSIKSITDIWCYILTYFENYTVYTLTVSVAIQYIMSFNNLNRVSISVFNLFEISYISTTY